MMLRNPERAPAHMTQKRDDLWWRRPYRMVQTNLRQIDASLDPKRLASQVKEFGADVLVFNIGGIYAFYPTDLEFHERNPYLKSDLLGEMIKAAHAEGIAVVGRFDMSKSTRKAYDAHPEWFVHNSKGQPLEYNGTYQACVNGGWYQDYAPKIIREALGRYDVDGVFFNMFGYRSTDYSENYHGICTCNNCRHRFRELYRRELPDRETFDDPAYRDYLEFQEKTTAELSELMYRTIKETNPNVAMTGHRHASDVIRLETQRAVDRPQPEWPYQAGEQARWGRMIGLDQKVFASTSTNFVDYAWRYASETGAYHMLRFAQQLASGATLDYYLLGTFDQDDVKPFEHIKKLYHWHKANESHYRDLVSGARVGLYHSRKSQVHSGATQTGKRFQDCLRGAYRALVESRIPFDFVSDHHGSRSDFASMLKRYDVLLMPNVTCLADEEAVALDEYVAGGGRLIATGEVGLYTAKGEPRPRPALTALPVMAISPDGSKRGAYFRIGSGELDLPHTSVLMLDGPYFDTVRKPEASLRLTMIPPQRFGPPELCFTKETSTRPGIIESAFGSGRCSYIPWLPEALYYRDSLPDTRAVITQLVLEASPIQPAVLTGRGPVELTFQQSRDGKRSLVHVVNFGGQRNNLYEDPADVHGLRLGVLEGRRARLLVEGITLEPSESTEGRTWFDLPPLRYFEAVEIGHD